VTTITIQNLADEFEYRLRIRAAERGRSIEEEARYILEQVLAEPLPEPDNLADGNRRHVAEAGGGFDLELPPRGPMREPPDFT
jgi:plasmid stability protein